ncbi:MAG: ABC transporter substrate-binding protein [Halanaerobiales bacterium]
MLKYIKLIFIFALIIFTLIACDKNSTTTSENKVDNIENTTTVGDSIVFAVVYPVEDVDDTTGIWEGINLAVDNINTEGGVKGREIKLIRYDDQGSVTRGLEIAQSLAEDDKVTAVIGHWNSRVSIAAAPIYEKAGKLMISPASTNSQLIKNDYNYIFQQVINSDREGSEIAEFAARDNYKNVAIFYADDAYGRELADSFSETAKAIDLEVKDRISFLGSNLEARRLVKKWQALDVELLFLADALPSAGRSLNRLRDSGLSIPIIGGTGIDTEGFINNYGKAAEGSYVLTFFNPDSERVEINEFVNIYLDKFGKMPDPWAVQGYDTVNILYEAIKRVNPYVPSNEIPGVLAEEIRQLGQWSGIGGDLIIGENGSIEGHRVIFKEVEDNRYIYLGQD